MIGEVWIRQKAMVNQNRMCCSQESLTKVLNAGNALFEKSGFLLHLPGKFHQGSCKKWTTQGAFFSVYVKEQPLSILSWAYFRHAIFARHFNWIGTNGNVF